MDFAGACIEEGVVWTSYKAINKLY
jgi:hypothetical protein